MKIATLNLFLRCTTFSFAAEEIAVLQTVIVEHQDLSISCLTLIKRAVDANLLLSKFHTGFSGLQSLKLPHLFMVKTFQRPKLKTRQSSWEEIMFLNPQVSFQVFCYLIFPGPLKILRFF